MKLKSEIPLTKEQRQAIKESIKSYFFDELDTELDDIQADFLLDFISEKLGNHFYNQGVSDTIKTMKERVDDLWLLIKDHQ